MLSMLKILKMLKTKFIAGLLASAIVSVHASLFVFSGPFADGGVISPGGTSFADPQTISGLDVSIASFTLALTFNNNDALASDGSGIQGQLLLGLAGGSPFVSFNPVDPDYAGGNATYDFTFSGVPGSPGSGFNGLNPNDTWSLELWDNNSTVGNGAGKLVAGHHGGPGAGERGAGSVWRGICHWHRVEIFLSGKFSIYQTIEQT